MAGAKWPEVSARAAVVMETAGGRVLYEKNADQVIPPASLTKLMTLHIAYKAIESGELARDQVVEIRPDECSPLIPYGSSLMYLEPGMRVSVLDLMQGLAVVSGNDGALALARVVAGSREAFVARMNAEARAMGYKVMRFDEPSGLSEKNLVTAREMADFSRRYIAAHPGAIGELHSLPSMHFPRPEVYPPGARTKDAFQKNRNALLFDYPGCDGLKTGYIQESGYNLVATAERNGTRFIVVTMGGWGSSSAEGGRLRTKDGSALLDAAFGAFVTLHPRVASIASVRIWGGSEEEIVPVPARSLDFTAPAGIAGAMAVRVDKSASLEAPIVKGRAMGEIVFSHQGEILYRVPLVADRDIPLGNIFVRLRDFFERLWLSIMGETT